MTGARWALLLAALVAVAGVSVFAWADRDSRPSTVVAELVDLTDPPTTTTEPPTTTTTRGPRGSGEPVIFAFGGDVHFEGLLRSKLDSDPAGVLDPIAPILRSVDLAVVNLETAVTERGTPAPKEFTFRAPASALIALDSAGIDVASMANNHGLDFGPQGLEDSLAARDVTGFPVVGIGRNAAEAYAPYRVTVNGQRIAVMGATQVLDQAVVAPTTTQSILGAQMWGDDLEGGAGVVIQAANQFRIVQHR